MKICLILLISILAGPAFSADLEPYPVERAALSRAFGLPEGENLSAGDSMKSFDLQRWLAKLPQAKENARKEGAVKAYLSVSMAYYLRAAERMKNKKLDSPWARLAYTETEIERLRQMPITFVIHEVREHAGDSMVEVQFYPELTGANDKEARALLRLSRGSAGLLVVDISAAGVSAYEVLRAGLVGMLNDTEQFIHTLLEKKIVTSRQIEEFSRP